MFMSVYLGWFCSSRRILIAVQILWELHNRTEPLSITIFYKRSIPWCLLQHDYYFSNYTILAVSYFLIKVKMSKIISMRTMGRKRIRRQSFNTTRFYLSAVNTNCAQAIWNPDSCNFFAKQLKWMGENRMRGTYRWKHAKQWEERQRQWTAEEKRENSWGDKSTDSGQTGTQADREKEKKEPCDNITPMDMNTMMNCVARFKSNPVVLSLMFTTQSQQGLEATLALSIILHTHTHSPAAVTQSCNSY